MKLYSVTEIANVWGVSCQIVRKYCREGRISTAIFLNGKWMIPDGTEKPGNTFDKNIEHSDLVKKILYQKERNNHYGIYEYLQINSAYSSNRLASNRLTRQQVEEIYRTGKVTSSFEAIRVDDIIEIINHFDAIDFILDSLLTPLSAAYIKQLHILLTRATFAQRSGALMPGNFRRRPAKINKQDMTEYGKINTEITNIISDYERKHADLRRIVDFHAKFEHIHPFDDYNGRVGRLLVIKECLRNNVDPFIIDDKKRHDYYRGLAVWEENKFLLMDTVIMAQEHFQSKMELCNLMADNKPQKNDLD